MQEIKCPKCGEVFQVDETGYAAIVKQVRDEEFHREIHERLERNRLRRHCKTGKGRGIPQGNSRTPGTV